MGIFPHLNINKLQSTVIELPAETFISLTEENSQQLHTSARPSDRGSCHSGVDPDTKLSPVFPELNGVATLDRLPRHLTECQIGSSAVTTSHNLTILQQRAEKQPTKYQTKSPIYCL